MTRFLASLAMLLFAVSGGAAQQPRVANGQLQVRPASGPLDREIRELASRATEASWVGYAVPSANPDSQMCCWNNGTNVTCGLEPGTVGAAAPASTAAPVRLDSGDTFFVLFRLERGEVTRIRTFSEECALDAGGRALQWLTGVNPRESVSVLAAYATSTTRRIANAALSALAMHAEATALDTLVKLARGAESTHVRGQALFWLAQRAGQKAVGTITEAVENDPETEVKRRAVFALSQLPRDEGVPLLINIARTHTNPAVRKQAMFWLGQSKDPRALKFFEEILLK
jgi:HEAT repeat protein